MNLEMYSVPPLYIICCTMLCCTPWEVGCVALTHHSSEALWYTLSIACRRPPSCSVTVAYLQPFALLQSGPHLCLCVNSLLWYCVFDVHTFQPQGVDLV